MATYIEKVKRVNDLKARLQNADYIASKLAEAIAEYLVVDNGDKSKLIAIYNEYQETIKNKQVWRDEINELKKRLDEV